jgi:hypothetical protein
LAPKDRRVLLEIPAHRVKLVHRVKREILDQLVLEVL